MQYEVEVIYGVEAASEEEAFDIVAEWIAGTPGVMLEGCVGVVDQ